MLVRDHRNHASIAREEFAMSQQSWVLWCEEDKFWKEEFGNTWTQDMNQSWAVCERILWKTVAQDLPGL